MRKWKYKEIYLGKGHKGARQNGCILEHRYVAEKILGRKLKDEEVVHHVDEDKENNKENNLIVFVSISDHTRFHQTGSLTKLDDGTYISEIKYNNCQKCGNLTMNKNFCSDECYYFYKRIAVRPTKEELEKLIIKYSFVSLGKMFNVSDNAIRKWCKFYNLPFRKKDLNNKN